MNEKAAEVEIFHRFLVNLEELAATAGKAAGHARAISAIHAEVEQAAHDWAWHAKTCFDNGICPCCWQELPAEHKEAWAAAKAAEDSQIQ